AADLSSHLRRVSGYGRGERYRGYRPLAPLFPDAGPALGPDGGFPALPCAVTRASVDQPTAERSAARLAHQSGGLGVASSNLAAPTIHSGRPARDKGLHGFKGFSSSFILQLLFCRIWLDSLRSSTRFSSMQRSARP